MRSRQGMFRMGLILWVACSALLLIRALPGQAADRTSLNIVVKDAQSGEPINQAHLTLQFREARKVGSSKLIAYELQRQNQRPGEVQVSRHSQRSIPLDRYRRLPSDLRKELQAR